MKLSIIIVTWNVKDLVDKLLGSIFHYSSGFEYEIIVVDNSSKDGTCEFIQDEYREWIESGKLKIICNTNNAGFAKANNQGLKIARGEYVLFMNPDMELIENSFATMIELMDKTPNIGISTCRLLYGDKSVQRNIKAFPTLCSQIFVMTKMHHFFSWLPCLKKYLQKDFNYSEYGYVDQVMGAFFCIRREMTQEIGLLDDGFFMWYEEVDYCKRAANAEWRTRYFADIEAKHKKGSSFDQVATLKKQSMVRRSLRRYMKKHFGLPAWLLFTLPEPFYITIALLVSIIKPK